MGVFFIIAFIAVTA
ncbi:Protein of unknown function [Bacillus cereus]|nr:Protein of unknown function [Bacillus cereus]